MILGLAKQLTVYFTRLNRSSTLQGWPVGIGLILRSLFIAFTLTYMIEVSSAAFDAHFAENPFLEANTLTDKSADPNGTLLTGLRSARTPLTQVSRIWLFLCYRPILTLHQTLAFWELSIVSKNRPDRRKLIFTDVRKPNSMWELILNECLQTLSDVEIALSKALSPSQLG